MSCNLSIEAVDYALKHGVYGNVNDDNNLYIEMHKRKIKNIPTNVLYHIHIPTHMRNKGLFTGILNELIKRSKNMYLLVGPFVSDESDYIIKVLERRGFQHAMPFSMYKFIE
jgi:hypothetical protein